ncbi:hypothetical protein F4805DRAFT_436434 [Annulohypoxylon moriforme]|nr:hypothetical protein F4805DRAFT_436434 [Annulohypoxylon moriforme]
MESPDRSRDHLLEHCTDCCKEEYGESRGNQSWSAQSWLRANAIPLFVLLVLLYIAIIQTIKIQTEGILSKPVEIHNKHFSLPKDILDYEERPEWSPPQYPWNQEPSDALDTIWNDLLYAINIRVRGSELDLLQENKTSRVQIIGGSGDDYIGVLGVYHHLHCLNNMRRLLNWNYYGPKIVNLEHKQGFTREHSNHCIDTIRQALMCHANTGLYTTEWDDETKTPNKIIKLNSMTTCVRWNSLDDWARARAFRSGHYKYKSPPQIS